MIACEEVKFLSYSLHNTDDFLTKREDSDSSQFKAAFRSAGVQTHSYFKKAYSHIFIVLSVAVSLKEGPGLMELGHSDHYIKPLLAGFQSTAPLHMTHDYSVYGFLHLIETSLHLAYHLPWQDYLKNNHKNVVLGQMQGT